MSQLALHPVLSSRRLANCTAADREGRSIGPTRSAFPGIATPSNANMSVAAPSGPAHALTDLAPERSCLPSAAGDGVALAARSASSQLHLSPEGTSASGRILQTPPRCCIDIRPLKSDSGSVHRPSAHLHIPKVPGLPRVGTFRDFRASSYASMTANRIGWKEIPLTCRTSPSDWKPKRSYTITAFKLAFTVNSERPPDCVTLRLASFQS